MNVVEAANDKVAPTKDSRWCLDTGSSRTMTNDLNDIEPSSRVKVEKQMTVGNSAVMQLTISGKSRMKQDGNKHAISLSEILYAPDAPMKLMSLGLLNRAGFDFTTTGDIGKVTKAGKLAFITRLRGNMWIIDNLRRIPLEAKQAQPPAKAADGPTRTPTHKHQGTHESSSSKNATKNSNHAKGCEGKKLASPVGKNFVVLQMENEMLEDSGAHASLAAVVESDCDLDDGNDQEDRIGGCIPVATRGSDHHLNDNWSEISIADIHIRMGHASMKQCHLIKGLPLPDQHTPELNCEVCEIMKAKKQPLPHKAETRASRALYRLHYDTLGKKRPTFGGNKYGGLLLDDYSRKGWTILAPTKADIPGKLLNIISQLHAERPEARSAFLRLDGAGEYTDEFTQELEKRGTRLEKSAPYRQGQNGVAERGLAIRWRMALSMMCQANGLEPDWGFAFSHAGVICNEIPSSSNDGLSPNDLWGDRRSRLMIEAPWGCSCTAKKYIRGKMEPHAVKCVYLGLALQYKAHIVRDLESGKARAHFSRDVKFFSSLFPYRHVLCRVPMSDPGDGDEEPFEWSREIAKVEVSSAPLDHDKHSDETPCRGCAGY